MPFIFLQAWIGCWIPIGTTTIHCPDGAVIPVTRYCDDDDTIKHSYPYGQCIMTRQQMLEEIKRKENKR